jgi:hypothetical protein
MSWRFTPIAEPSTCQNPKAPTGVAQARRRMPMLRHRQLRAETKVFCDYNVFGPRMAETSNRNTCAPNPIHPARAPRRRLVNAMPSGSAPHQYLRPTGLEAADYGHDIVLWAGAVTALRARRGEAASITPRHLHTGFPGLSTATTCAMGSPVWRDDPSFQAIGRLGRQGHQPALLPAQPRRPSTPLAY